MISSETPKNWSSKVVFSPKKNLGIRLFSTIIAIIITVLLAYTVFSVVHESNRTRTELAKNGETLLNMLSYSARVGVFAENKAVLKDAAEGVLNEPDVIQVAIYNEELKLLYSADKKKPLSGKVRTGNSMSLLRPKPYEISLSETSSTVELIKSVILKVYTKGEETLYIENGKAETRDKVIGYVKVVLEKEGMNRQILGILKRNSVLALFFIVSSVVVVYFSVRKITKPLENLTEKVKELGSGKEMQPIPVESQDDIGRLSMAFNSMVEGRKHAEHALRDSEKKYRELFEESINVIFIMAPEGRIIDINPAGVSLFGCSSKEEVIAHNMLDDLYENREERAAYTQIVEREGFIREFPVKMRKKDGQLLHIAVTATAVRNGAGEIVAYRGMLRDVTTERSLEQQLMHAQKMEAVGRLTGGIAHDFNNILTAIVSYAYRLQVSLSRKQDALEIIATKIITASEKAAGLISSMLTFTRKQILNTKPVDLNELVRKSRDMFSRVIGEDIVLKIRLTPDNLVINADSGQIEQILMNFIVNARDAMPSGGELIINTKLFTMDGKFISAHGYGREGGYAALAVTDTGSGMDPETTKKIFEPFFTTKQIGKGTGLGLSIVYGIVQQHSGYVDVKTEPAKGTTFTVYIPLLHTDAIPAALEEQENSRGGSETILIAEDEDDVREGTESVLREAGYAVITTVDGDDAMQKFVQNKDRINLVVLDMVMPGKTGMRVYQEIKSYRPGTENNHYERLRSRPHRFAGALRSGAYLYCKTGSSRDIIEKGQTNAGRRPLLIEVAFVKRLTSGCGNRKNPLNHEYWRYQTADCRR